MPYYVSIKPYNSTIQEFCAVQLRLYGRVGPQTLPKPVRAMESGDTEKKQQILRTESINTCNANRSYTNRFAAHLCCSSSLGTTTMLRTRIRAQNKNGVYTTERKSVGVALSCTLHNHFLVKGTAPARKKPICAKMKINTYADFELCLFTEEEEEEEDVEEIGF